jgi:hypothetical protein
MNVERKLLQDEMQLEKQCIETQRSECSISFSSLRRNLEAFALIWYCNTAGVFNQHQIDMKSKLRESINFLITLRGIEECEEFIRHVKDMKIILVVSDPEAKKLLQKVHDLEQLTTIYIYGYCENESGEYEEIQMENYKKVGDYHEGIF